MFSGNVRTGHEPQAKKLIATFFDRHEGRIGDRELREWIRARDREMALEVDSSWLNVLILDSLANEFAGARFVLTIRDCYSWLNSEFKRVLRTHSQQALRVKMRELLYQPESPVYAPEEKALEETGLYPLGSYLFRWVAHNEQVLGTIPKERLLIVRTGEITQHAYEIADFAGLPRYTVRLQRTHDYRNPVKREVIKEIDRDFLEKKVEAHCRPLMERFFPEIKTLDDAKL
jgi:hypothetical protein